jgi:hypothetical protein
VQRAIARVSDVFAIGEDFPQPFLRPSRTPAVPDLETGSLGRLALEPILSLIEPISDTLPDVTFRV